MNKFRNLKTISLVCILALALVFIGFHLLQAQGKPDKDKPPDKGKPAPEPLQFEPPNIVTTGEDALSVWNFGVYDAIWSTKTPGYNSVAVGNIDNYDNLEIVVPEIKEIRKKGGCKSCAGPFKVFLNVYKEGESDIWESTEGYGEGVDGGYVMDPARLAQVMIDNVDQDEADEVILRTLNYLSVFKYENGMLKIVKCINVSELELQPKAVFYAVTTGDIIQGDDKEIIVFVKDWEYPLDKGWIYIFNKDLLVQSEITGGFDISLAGESFCVADLDGDDYPEICLTGDHGSFETGFLPYVFVWDWDVDSSEWNLADEELIPGWYADPSNPNPYTGLDVGELDGDSGNGDEIVVYSNLPGTSDYQLIIYKYNNGIFTSTGLVQIQAHFSNIEIGDVDGDEGNEIIAAGRATLGTQYVFYLDVFDSDLNRLWSRVGERKEGLVSDTAIVEK